MQRRSAWAGGLLLGIGLFLAGSPAQALITRSIPLGDLLKENQFIFLARVDSVLPEKPGLVLMVAEQFKGKVPFNKMAINLTGDREAKKYKHTPQLLKRVAPKLPVVLFANRRHKFFIVFAYTNGTWFQVKGQKDADSDRVRWGFTHCEPYLRRTFAGTTDELRKIIKDGLAGKKKPPEPNPKEKPGLGPEVKTRRGDKETRRQGDKE